MSYTALYRKLRPQVFEDIIGQDLIVKTLKNQIKSNITSHAYLFTGTRGTGKTSTAKIFAKAVNCENPIEGSPCNQCQMCLSISKNMSHNIVEMDAASNNGVDTIREINDEVRYAPPKGNFRVYIIDEVHMLTTEAFNALLKTLEEPPKHVKFVLATTEVHKIPITILSRCQRYDFRRISTLDIKEAIASYAEKEKIQIKEKALAYIAKLADGSMRDALSILDQCMAFYMDEEIGLEQVLTLLGQADKQLYFDLTRSLNEMNPKGAISLLDNYLLKGGNPERLIIGQVEFLRNLLLIKSLEDASDFIEEGEETYKQMEELASSMEDLVVLALLKDLTSLVSEIKYQDEKRTLIEVKFLEITGKKIKLDRESLVSRLSKLERRLANLEKKPRIEKVERGGQELQEDIDSEGKNLDLEKGKLVGKTDKGKNTHQQVKASTIGKKTEQTGSLESGLKDLDDGLWNEILATSASYIKVALSESKKMLRDKTLYISYKREADGRIIKMPGTIEEIKKILKERLGQEFELEVLAEEDFNSSLGLKQAQKETTKSKGLEQTIEKEIGQIKSKINFDIKLG